VVVRRELLYRVWDVSPGCIEGGTGARSCICIDLTIQLSPRAKRGKGGIIKNLQEEGTTGDKRI